MPVPTQEELDVRIQQLSNKALELGATPEEINSITNRLGSTANLPSPTKPINDLDQFISTPAGFNPTGIGFSSPTGVGFSAPDYDQHIGNTVEYKRQQLAENTLDKVNNVADKTEPFVSDIEMTTIGGQLTNQGLAFYTGTKQAAASFLAAAPSIVRHTQLKGLTDDDFALYATAKIKNEQRDALTKRFDLIRKQPQSEKRDQQLASLNDRINATRLTEEEDAIFREQEVPAPKGLPHAKPRFSKSKAAKIEQAREATAWIDTLNGVVQETRDKINTTFSGPALKKVENQNQRAVASWQEGNYFESLGEFGKGVLDLATEDTGTAIQVFAESLPYMISMMAAGSVTLPVEAIRLNHESTNEFIEEFGSLPNETEQQLIQMLSLAGAATDKVAASVTGNMAKHVKNVIKASRKLNQRLPKKLIQGLTTVGAPVAAFVTEGGTEGLQNVIQQTASSIRDVSIDPVAVLTDTAIGGITGVGFAAPSVVADVARAGKTATDKGLEVVGKKLEKRAEKLQRDISTDTEKVLADENVSTEEKIDRIIGEGIQELSVDKRKERINQLATLAKSLPQETEEETSLRGEVFNKVSELIKANKELTKKETEGFTTPEAIKNISEETEEASPQEVKQADANLKSVVTEMKGSTSITLDQAERVFGSIAFKRASKEDQEVVRNYIKTIKDVSKDIQTGDDPQFKGLQTHLEELDNAVILEDQTAAANTVSRLKAFEKNQVAKIKAYESNLKEATKVGKELSFEFGGETKTANPNGSTARLINIQKQDLKAIRTSIGKAEEVFNTAFDSEPQVDAQETVTSEATVEPSVKVSPKPSKVTPEVRKAPEQAPIKSEKKVETETDFGANTKPAQPPEIDRVAREKLLNKAKVLGDSQNKLPTEALENRRTQLVKELSKPIVNTKRLKDLTRLLKELTVDARKPQTEVVGTKGSHNKNLSENLITDTSNREEGNANALEQKVTKSLENPVGTPAGFTVKDIFKLKANLPDNFFNGDIKTTVHNFFSRYKKGGFTKAIENKIGKLSKEEEIILDNLATFANKFRKVFEAQDFVLNTKQLFPENSNTLSTLDQHVLGYLAKEDSAGNRYYNENMVSLMAISAYNWLGTRSRDTLLNLDRDINNILGRDSETPVTAKEREVFSKIGTTQTNLAETLGREVVKELGLEVTDKVDGNMLDRLAMSIGLSMIGTMAKQGLITQSSLTAEEMSEFKGEANTNFDPKAKTNFIRLVPAADNDIRSPQVINDIADALDGSKDFLERMFNIKSHEKFVSKKPVTFVPKTLKGTIQSIPKKIKDTIKRAQQVEWEVSPTKDKLVRNLSAETLGTIAGKVDLATTKVHVNRRESVEAKNESIQRELENYIRSSDELNGSSFYLAYESIKNMRLMVVGNMLNPQASKIHRHLVNAKAWNTTVEPEGTPKSDRIRLHYKLAIAQAFGFSIDKKNPIKSLDFFYSLLANETVQKGIDSLEKLQEGNLTREEQTRLEDDLKAAVKLGGENMHTLDGLVALSQYKEFEAFETNIGLETDGVTNGVAISLMQAPLEEGMKAKLASAGIYTDGSVEDNFPEWIDNPANQDLYQQLSSEWTKQLTKVKSQDSERARKTFAIEQLIGQFYDSEGVTSLGRNLAKDPLMVTNYGAGIKSVVKDFSTKVLSEIYTKLEKSESETETRIILENIYNVIGKPVPSNINHREPLEISLTAIEGELITAISSTYGKALEDAMDTQFKQFFKFRGHVNLALNSMFLVFNKYYKEDLSVAEETKGRKLSPKEQLDIFKQNQQFMPTFNAPTSIGIDDSLLVIKTEKKRSYSDKKDRVQVNFVGSPFEANSVSGVVAHNEYKEPGVSGIPLGTQSQDISTQIQTMHKFDMLNVHDAIIQGVDQIGDATASNNEAFWDVTKNYSILEEVHNSYLRVMQLAQDDLALIKEVNDYIVKNPVDKKIPRNLAGFNKDLLDLRKEVTSARKELFEAQTTISQFGLDAEATYRANASITDIGIADFISNSIDEAVASISEQFSDSEALTLVGEVEPVTPSQVEKLRQEKSFKKSKDLLAQLKAKDKDAPRNFGSSTEQIDFDNFNSHYDEMLTAQNSLQIFDDMENFGNKQESTEHRNHLKDILQTTVNKGLTAVDALAFKVGNTSNPTHGAIKGQQVYINAATGNRLTNSDMSTQEVQVHELVHAVTQSIDSNFVIRKEVLKLFKRVSSELTKQYGKGKEWKAFMPDTVLIDSKEEVRAAKARYNYIFNNQNTTQTPEGIRNDFLHEFMAFGLTNEKFISILSKIPATEKKELKNLSIKDKLIELYERLINKLSGKIYGIADVNTDKALRALVDRLITVSNRQKNQALQYTTVTKTLDDKFSKAINDYIFQPFIEWRLDSGNVTTSRTGKALDVVATVLDTERSKGFKKALKEVLRRLGLTEKNLLLKLVREIQGAKDSNIRWHKLLRYSKHVIDNARKKLATDILKDIRRNMLGGLPSKEESKAITRAFFKTDLTVLLASQKTSEGATGRYTAKDVLDMLRSKNKLMDEIISTRKELDVFGTNTNYYTNQARGLGNVMAKSSGAVDNQMLNAYNIATLATRNEAVIGDVVKAEEIIERLATLYALLETEPDNKKLLANVMEREYKVNAEDNGFVYLVNLHNHFKEESLAQLFKGNKRLMIKGYIHESFNPNVDIKIATLDEKEELERAGYVIGEDILTPDSDDPNQAPRYMYVNKNNVGHTYQKSIASLTSRSLKGSSLLDGYQNTGSGTPTKDSLEALERVKSLKGFKARRQFTQANYPTDSDLIPVLNEKGEIKGYRYMMTEHQKTTLLERDDRYDSVLGAMFGSITDKVESKDVNRQVIELAYEDYQEGFTKEPNAYIRIAADASEQRYKELYSLLPEEVRRDMVSVWGKKEIYVREELVDLIFGYRKWSIGDVFKNRDLVISDEDTDAVKIQKQSMQHINKLLNAGITRQIEAVWQEVVSVAKTNIVIRNPAVLIGNVVSNFVLSWVKGVPVTYIIKNQALALNALNEYQQDVSKRDSLQRTLDITPNLSKVKRDNINREINQLNDSISTNPVRELIDEGIFQSIVEDIEGNENPFSFRDKILKDTKVSNILESKAAKPVTAISEQLYLSENTSAFQLLMKATQYSDFIARFAMHKYNTEVKGMDKETSLQDVIETFINYDIPTSRALQYMNDMGFFMFSKFLFRIQKVIFKILKENPASTLSLLLLQNFFGDVSDILDSNLITGSLAGRLGFIAGPLDSATELSGANIVMDIVGY